MTTIVANLLEMSVDSFISDGNRTVKLLSAPGLIVGFSGELANAARLAKWVIDGSRGMPPIAKDDDVDILILRRSGLSMLDEEGYEVALDGTYASVGSGSDIALGAMWSGKTPAEAVEAAAWHDGGTKLPVHTLKLKGRK